ncbi:hypothetical protein DL93DRAFT_364674 [Clavulina sp. PMI_390]|nr:hypothetical protein DL93DRAFT_364674 [Clavulina sp. PMI_390]
MNGEDAPPSGSCYPPYVYRHLLPLCASTNAVPGQSLVPTIASQKRKVDVLEERPALPTPSTIQVTIPPPIPQLSHANASALASLRVQLSQDHAEILVDRPRRPAAQVCTSVPAIDLTSTSESVTPRRKKAKKSQRQWHPAAISAPSDSSMPIPAIPFACGSIPSASSTSAHSITSPINPNSCGSIIPTSATTQPQMANSIDTVAENLTSSEMRQVGALDDTDIAPIGTTCESPIQTDSSAPTHSEGV